MLPPALLPQSAAACGRVCEVSCYDCRFRCRPADPATRRRCRPRFRAAALAAAIPEDIRAVDRDPSRLNPDPAPAPLTTADQWSNSCRARGPSGPEAMRQLRPRLRSRHSYRTTCTHELPRWIPRMCDRECSVRHFAVYSVSAVSLRCPCRAFTSSLCAPGGTALLS